MVSYFSDMIANTPDVWNPANPKGLGIILAFWGVIAISFIFLNKYLIQRPIFRNIPEGADVDISTLPGGEDDKVHQLGDLVPGFEHLASEDTVFEAEAV